MVVLSFCTPCGNKRLKEVKYQLETLFSSKVAPPGVCCICNAQQTFLSPNVDTSQNEVLLAETKEKGVTEKGAEHVESDWMTVCLKTGLIKKEPNESISSNKDVVTDKAENICTEEGGRDKEGKVDDVNKISDDQNCKNERNDEEDEMISDHGEEVDLDCKAKSRLLDDAHFRLTAMRPELSKLVTIGKDARLPLKCTICNDVSKQFAGVNHLMNHFTSHCGSVNINKEMLQTPYQCFDCCNKLFKTFGDWTRHTQLYQCRYPDCRQRFKSHSSLDEHERSSHSKDERAFKCKYCGKRFLTVQTRWGHIHKYHPSVKPTKIKMQLKKRNSKARVVGKAVAKRKKQLLKEEETLDKPKVRQRTVFKLTEEEKTEDIKLQITGLRPELKEYLVGGDESDTKLFCCTKCDRLQFISFRRFCFHACSQHLKNEDLLTQLFQCNECCDEKFTNFSQWKAHTKPHKCQVPGCNYRNAIRTKVSEHYEMAHTNERRHKCTKCPLAFNQQQALRKHVRVVHDKIRKFTCSYCGFRFAARNNLVKHERRHTNEKPFHCDQCDQSFSTNIKLKVHRMDHTGEKPFVCDHCGFRTKTKADLKSHLRIMHSSEKKMFQCDICGISITTKSNMNKHRRKHTGEKKYKCRFCNQYFLYHDSRERHEKTHPEWDGVRKHVCQVCGKDLHSKYKLQIHMVIHSGTKPFECSHCDYKSHRKSGLVAHMKRHEREQQLAAMMQTGDIQPQGSAHFMIL